MEFVIMNIFSQMIADIPFTQIPDKCPLVIVFDVTTSLPLENAFASYWDEAWQKEQYHFSC